MGSLSKDFHVTIKVKNGRIISRMRELGISSVAELSRISGANHQVIGHILRLQKRPFALGEWIEAAYDISSALRCEPEDLWPEHIAHLKARSGEVSFEADLEEVQAIASQVDRADLLDRANLPRLLTALTPRQREVVEKRYGLNDAELTLDAVAADHGVSKERIRQIEMKALRNLAKEHVRQVNLAARKQLKVSVNG